MTEKINEINGIDICTESFGKPEDPALLLIMGAMCSMVYWDDEFCQRLAETGRYVIRYDNRDVGRSIAYEPGTSNYSVKDLAEDAIGIMDAYQINQAHLVGMSLGGMIAQVAALKYPNRVSSLTLIASSIIGTEDILELPPMDEKILEYHASGAKLDWTDEEAVADYLVAGSKLLCGSAHEFEEGRSYKQVKKEINRANNLLSMFNHSLLESDDSFVGMLSKDIKVPTLVIHGTEDTILPYGHALALTSEIPQTLLLSLEGSGHEIHSDDWEDIINVIFDHTVNR